MGRPKKNSADVSSTEKNRRILLEIVKQRWSSDGYEHITIPRLTQDTGLNNNTIYYHRDNVEDIARKAVEHLTDSEVVTAFTSQFLTGENSLILTPAFVPRIKKVLLLAESDSPFLQSFVKTTLLQT